jgi:hypothetical protein
LILFVLCIYKTESLKYLAIKLNLGHKYNESAYCKKTFELKCLYFFICFLPFAMMINFQL